jgi:hypothetical protein
VAIGVVAALVLPRSGRERVLIVPQAAAVTAVAAVVFTALQATYSQVFTPGF